MLNIPHQMSKLARSAKGLPVPWVADWTSEENQYLKYEPLIKRVAVFTRGSIGDGEPILGQMNPQRQRKAMIEKWCQVCNRRAKQCGDLWLVDIPGQQKTDDGSMVILEPWACTECLSFALSVCPGLLRMQRDGNANVLRVREYEILLALIEPRGNLAGVPIPEGGIIGYAKAAPTVYESIKADDWLKGVFSLPTTTHTERTE